MYQNDESEIKLTPGERFEEAAKKEEKNQEPFYKFFVCDYYATGEGRSLWLMVDRWYGEGRSDPLGQFKKFIDEPFYFLAIEEFTEERFLSDYNQLIPDKVKQMIAMKDQYIFNWMSKFHFNLS